MTGIGREEQEKQAETLRLAPHSKRCMFHLDKVAARQRARTRPTTQER